MMLWQSVPFACILLALGSAVYARAAEVRAYETAVTFFEENGLPV